jgi:hypothetical protein
MNIINKIFGKLEFIVNSRHVNWLTTLYFNFRTMPFSVACKLPVYIYGWNTKIVSLSGTVSFDCTPKRGMVKIGRHRDYYTPITNTILKIGKRGG